MKREARKRLFRKSYGRLKWEKEGELFISRMWRNIGPIGDVRFDIECNAEGYAIECRDLSGRLVLIRGHFTTEGEMIDYAVDFLEWLSKRAEELRSEERNRQKENAEKIFERSTYEEESRKHCSKAF